MEKKRLIGIIVCGILVIILAIILDLSHFWLLHIDALNSNSVNKWTLPIWKFPITVVYIMSAVFLLSLKRWARLLVISFTAIQIVIYIYVFRSWILPTIGEIIPHGNRVDYGIVWTVLLHCILVIGTGISIIIYLTRSEVKEQFK
jgi:hypothetical protein